MAAALMEAVRGNRVAVVKLLIDSNVNVNLALEVSEEFNCLLIALYNFVVVVLILGIYSINESLLHGNC